jgi:hypothetical protein
VSNSPTPQTALSGRELLSLALERARQKAREAKQQAAVITSPPAQQPLTSTAQVATSGELILNKEQAEAVELGNKFTSFCLIGAAGTGKTTCQGELVSKLLRNPLTQTLQRGTKYLTSGRPGIVICAFTRRAVRNIRKRMPLEIQSHCLTIHSLLQYAPTTESYFNKEGELRERRVYKPTFTALNKLPGGLRTVIVEEASMVSTELFNILLAALPYGQDTQFIFLGDLNQIPPVYGNPILAKKLLSLPTVELTQVYRQALESPILALAHKIREGKLPAQKNRERQNLEGTSSSVVIRTWQKDLTQEMAEATFYSALRSMVTSGQLFSNLSPGGVIPDLPTSVLLCPWNKNFGNFEMNKICANALAVKFGQLVHEVVCGWQKRYFRVGEQVLIGKLDATITAITKNPKYVGNRPKPATPTLTYWGHDSGVSQLTNVDDSMEMLASLLSSQEEDTEDITKQSSHAITYFLNDDEDQKMVTITAAGEITSIEYNYCLSVHKAQGSEWDKVFLLLHKCHLRMASRELLYTAITRAKTELEILQPLNGLTNGCTKPRIKGVTLQEKLSYLKILLEKEEKEKLTLESEEC